MKVKISDDCPLKNKSVTLGFTYRLENGSVQPLYQNLYSLDLLEKNSERWLWLHKDECLVSKAVCYKDFSSMASPMPELIRYLSCQSVQGIASRLAFHSFL